MKYIDEAISIEDKNIEKLELIHGVVKKELAI